MTIKDLAAKTGYSVGTVSRVLNDQPHVSETAREVILRAAEECGFQLNTNAKQLKQQHGTSILVIRKSSNNELFDSLLVAIQARIARSRYPLIVDYIDETDNEVHRAIQLCQEKKPLAVIFLGGRTENFREDFHKIAVPCVLVTTSAAGLTFPNLSSVCADDNDAAQLAIDQFIALGHRKFAVIGGDRKMSDTSQLRFEGCMDAFRRSGISFDPELDYETARYSYLGGYRAAQALLSRERKFTALFAMSDVMAIGAIRALRDAGLRVPEDISVMGLDGLTIGEYTTPRLSTVAQAVDSLAEQSLGLLHRSLEKGDGSRHEIVPVTLWMRESVRKL
ncbi:MAG: LacI family DNA-binding transcriptional regulator [Oscillospiraceae bacterium]|nr:LacI family DNA-binding transcriptional regulator [Oscillospiraceae bacterium]